MADLYYLVSVKHTHKRDPYITFWRPDNKGYCYALSAAGKYDYPTIARHWDYYVSDNTFPVPCEMVESIGIAPRAGIVDSDGGPVVQNNSENMNRLRAAAFIGAQTGT
jgi:hypothetical protein